MRITKHAYERAKDRFGLCEQAMDDIVRQEFGKATMYNDGDSQGLKFYLEKRNMILVQSKDRKSIVTVYPMADRSKIELCSQVTDELKDFLEERRYRFKKDFSAELAELTKELSEMSTNVSRTARKIYVDDGFYNMERKLSEVESLIAYKREVLSSYSRIEKKIIGGK